MMPRGHDRIADAPYTGVTSATLLGRAHRLSGQVAVADARGRAAVGLARGWMPKPYAYVDPNEDVVACSVADHGHLLIVADGHNGHRASHVAVAEVMDTFADAVPEHFDQDTVLDVSEAVERRIAAGLNPQVGSVASVFISRWDVAVTGKVPSELTNRLGIAIAGARTGPTRSC